MDRLIYAFTDIHGRMDLLHRALDEVVKHQAGRPAQFIFCGDYVDRGAYSRQVLEYLKAATEHPGSATYVLKGNHEQMLISAWRDPTSEAMGLWLANGGLDTLISYGTDFARDIQKVIPEEVIVWLEGLPTMVQSPRGRAFVHAGVMPGFKAGENPDEVLMWIRDRFLRAKATDFPDLDHIVHGHTPSHALKKVAVDPELLPHRTNLDVGAHFSNTLAVGVFDPDTTGPAEEVLIVTATRCKKISGPQR